ncbi:MAG: ATP-dependent DNA helicase RecG [bacterium]|nr:ATP-dependent DNA helicase RecG [bacterium]
MDLSTELTTIQGIGGKFATRLKKLGIATVKDLLWHFPFRYEDYSRVVPIGELAVDQSATIQGEVHQLTTRRTWKKNFLITEAIIVDGTGGVKAVWFNQPYINNILKEGGHYNFAGKVTKSKREIYLASPSYEPIDKTGHTETKHTAGLIPIYPETRGLTSKGLRYLIKPLLKDIDYIEDFVPEEILKEHKFPGITLALKRIHFPLKRADADGAKKRFAFENLFLLQLNNLTIKSKLAKEKAHPLTIAEPLLTSLINQLPFQLTESQKTSLHEILGDCAQSHPMNRLLQGDVGSGKTVIAAIAAISAAHNNCQTAFMAPTEVLASQHYRTITSIFKNFNKGVAIVTANRTDVYYGDSLSSHVSKAKLLKEIGEGTIGIVIGTHAIIQKNVQFKNLALAIVDEQHRFGVAQRAALLSNKELGIKNNGSVIHNSSFIIPHFLSMSATPIPRTLSLTAFGDLDLSTITELPAGRKEIITKIVAPENREKAYGFIREQIQKGRQAFVICPRIEPGQVAEGEVLTEAKRRALDVRSVKEEYEKLANRIFSDLKVVMIHGKMKGKEKNEIMRAFQAGESHILVSTSVIEVGVDVPNSTIMMIEGADRFGLAQLYQFRGRVGRGEHQSFCLLFSDSKGATASRRLNYLLTAKNGFELAEKDLLLRGPGQFLGGQQTGLPDVAMDALKDIQLVKAARDAAKNIISNDPDFIAYPALAERFSHFQKAIHLE